MKRASAATIATFTALALTGSIALAQSSGGSTGGTSTGGSSASPASPASPTTPGTNPGGSPTPGVNPPAPSDLGTTGRAPGVNPANSQDMSRRGNPQDLTTPRGMNPQDSRAPGTPQIYKPEMGDGAIGAVFPDVRPGNCSRRR
jgi:hypothetical protein